MAARGRSLPGYRGRALPRRAGGDLQRGQRDRGQHRRGGRRRTGRHRSPVDPQRDRARPPQPRPALPARLRQDPARPGLGAHHRLRRGTGRDGEVVRRASQLVGTPPRPGPGGRGGMVPEQAVTAPRRVLLSGANGQLGRDVQAVLGGRTPDGGDPGSAVALAAARAVGSPDQVSGLGTDIDTVDVADANAVDEAFDEFHPDVVIHAGAYTAVDASESDPDTALAVNTVGTRHVPEASGRFGGHVLYVSTDYVFDGDADRPYVEGDAPNPRSVYGR